MKQVMLEGFTREESKFAVMEVLDQDARLPGECLSGLGNSTNPRRFAEPLALVAAVMASEKFERLSQMLTLKRIEADCFKLKALVAFEDEPLYGEQINLSAGRRGPSADSSDLDPLVG